MAETLGGHTMPFLNCWQESKGPQLYRLRRAVIRQKPRKLAPVEQSAEYLVRVFIGQKNGQLFQQSLFRKFFFFRPLQKAQDRMDNRKPFQLLAKNLLFSFA